MDMWGSEKIQKKTPRKRRSTLRQMGFAVLAGLGIGGAGVEVHDRIQTASVVGPAVAGDKNSQKRELVTPNSREVLAALRAQREGWAAELAALKKRQHELGMEIIQHRNDPRAFSKIKTEFASPSEENNALYARINTLDVDIKKLDGEIHVLEQKLGSSIVKK